ncbi:hypothetical protein [Actinomadura parmotrematis]|uniref:YbhB/YbcL family Raf kinase inhibitor-like protein n=1 Tax=Actinomadura parmotrematis TaxID=2864039 RepID=A0ABS7FLW7_9ACTN|nr:hypothetical protein [Actinomadura parmotrematis]MBW8481382.1 hypothetical protein [Actinomadura parmotrematis]
MNPKVNIIALVDVVGALSDGGLGNGNLGLVDDSAFESTGRGTPDLCTVVQPGQVVQWSALAVDVQTPVEIRDIVFLGPDGQPAGPARPDPEPGENLDVNVWSGVVPYLAPGVPHRYRLELQMHEGPHAVLHVDSPALMCP